jgi:AcrR family transcriptional regulator
LRIARAAYERFCERGYSGTTMADVARAAGVAVQTVYFAFHTKAELLGGAYDLAVLGELDPRPPNLQPWYLAAAAEPDFCLALRALARGVGEIVRRAAPLETVVRETGRDDPESEAVWEHHEQLRVDGYRAMVALLRAKAPLAPGVTIEIATDLFLFHLGPHAYRGLVMDRGWSHDAWVEWASTSIDRQVFGGVGDGSLPEGR